MEVRAPIDLVEILGQLHFAFAVHGDGEELQHVLLVAVAAEDDPLPVRREERPAVIAGNVGQLPDVRAVSIHDEYVRTFAA